MLALTIRQPHASAILYLGKNIENRSWFTPHRGLIAIHAAASVDKDAPDWMANLLADRMPVSHLIGVVEISDALVGAHRSRWARPGLVHWMLEKPKVLVDPVPCRGYQGLWRVPGPLEKRVSSQL